MSDPERLLVALRRAFLKEPDQQRNSWFRSPDARRRQNWTHTFYFPAPPTMRRAYLWATDLAGAVLQGEPIGNPAVAWGRINDAVEVILGTKLSDVPLEWQQPLELVSWPNSGDWRGWFEFELVPPPEFDFEQTLTALATVLERTE